MTIVPTLFCVPVVVILVVNRDSRTQERHNGCYEKHITWWVFLVQTLQAGQKHPVLGWCLRLTTERNVHRYRYYCSIRQCSSRDRTWVVLQQYVLSGFLFSCYNDFVLMDNPVQ